MYVESARDPQNPSDPKSEKREARSGKRARTNLPPRPYPVRPWSSPSCPIRLTQRVNALGHQNASFALVLCVVSPSDPRSLAPTPSPSLPPSSARTRFPRPPSSSRQPTQEHSLPHYAFTVVPRCARRFGGFGRPHRAPRRRSFWAERRGRGRAGRRRGGRGWCDGWVGGAGEWGGVGGPLDRAVDGEHLSGGKRQRGKQVEMDDRSVQRWAWEGSRRLVD